MKKYSTLLPFVMLSMTIFSQTIKKTSPLKKTDLYVLVKAFIPDSTGYSNVGDWGVKVPNLKWTSPNLEMSDNMDINFFYKGVANLSVSGSAPAAWNVMLYGPRAGYTAFNIMSPELTMLEGKHSLDSLFGKGKFQATVIKKCDQKPGVGFTYYEVKLPKKDKYWMKVIWVCSPTGCRITIEARDEGSKNKTNQECK